jgi:hypothetical protein
MLRRARPHERLQEACAPRRGTALGGFIPLGAAARSVAPAETPMLPSRRLDGSPPEPPA